MAELPNRQKLEARFALLLSRAGTQLRKRLESLLGNPPDIRNVPAKFWSDQEAEIGAALLLLLGDIYYRSAVHHGWSGEIDDSGSKPVNTLDQAAAKFAEMRAGKIASSFTSNSREILERDAKTWEPAAKQSMRTIRETTLKMFGPRRMARVAVTETTVAQHQGAETAAEETGGLSEDDTWHTSERSNVCPICRPLNKKKRSVWSRFFPEGPPAHGNCNCWIDYRTP